MYNQLKFHHIGCLTRDIEDSVKQYNNIYLFSNNDVVNVTTQKVKIRFITLLEPETYLELIQPLDKSSKLFELMNRGATFYHIAFKVDNYNNFKDHLDEYQLEFVTEFKSEAFNNKRCMFVRIRDKTLLEIIEE